MAIDVERLVAEIDADPAKAIAALRAFEAEVANAAKDRRAKVTVDADTSGLDQLNGGLGRLTSASSGSSSSILSLGTAIKGLTFGAMYSGATMAAGALSGLAGAAGGAVGALGPLSGLLATLPVGFGAVVGGIGATMLGLSGVSKGYSAMTGLQNQAAQSTDILAQKQRTLADALYAQKRAQESLADAQKAMAAAPAEAAEALSDQRRAVKGAILGEEAAVLRLKQAQENLRKVQDQTAKSGYTLTKATDAFSGKQVEIARMSVDATNEAASGAQSEAQSKLAVKEAELAVRDARDSSSDAQKKLNEMEKKGIKNSDQVVAARRRLRDAEHSAMLAARSVNDAQKDLAKGVTGTTAALNAYDLAMKGLSPTGRAFVKFLHDEFVPAFKQVRTAAQEGLLPGVTHGLRDLMKMFPMLAGQARAFGKTVGDSFSGFMSTWSEAGNQDRLSKTLSGLNGVLRRMFRLATPLADILLRVTDAATPLTNRILKGLTRELKTLDKWMSGKKGKSVLDEFFGTKKKGDIGTVYKFTRLWVGVLRPLAGILGGVSKAAEPLATWMLKSLGDYLGTVNDNIRSINGQESLTKYFNDQKPAIRETAGALKDLAKVLFGSSEGGEKSAFVQTMKAIRADVIPALGDLMKTLDKSDFGAEFAKFVGGLGDGLSHLLAQDGVITLTLKALNDISDVLGELSKITGGKSSDAIAKAIAAYGIYKFASKLGGGRSGKPNGGVLGGLLGGKAGGVQNVRVINWPRGGLPVGPGGGDPLIMPNGGNDKDGDGKPKSRPRKPRKPRTTVADAAGIIIGLDYAVNALKDVDHIPGGGHGSNTRAGRRINADKHGNAVRNKYGHTGGDVKNEAARAQDAFKIIGAKSGTSPFKDFLPGLGKWDLGNLVFDVKQLDRGLAGIAKTDPKRAFNILKIAARDSGLSMKDLREQFPKTNEALQKNKHTIDASSTSLNGFTQHFGGAVKALNNGRTPIGLAEGKVNKFGESVKGTSAKQRILNGELDTMRTRLDKIPPRKATHISTPGLIDANKRLDHFNSVWNGLTNKQVTLTLKGLTSHNQTRLDARDPTADGNTTKGGVVVNQTFNEVIDPKHVAAEVAWALRN